MLVALVAIALLIGAVCAIYFLLKSMGQDGVEVAAPGSCRSGKCGVRKDTATEVGCLQEKDRLGEADEVAGMPAQEQAHGTVDRQDARLG